MGHSSHYPEMYRNDLDWDEAEAEAQWQHRRRRMLEDARLCGEPAPDADEEDD
jgi:hypothetical protein